MSNGWVTLTGEMEWDFQRRAAKSDVRKLGGVVGVINEIKLRPRLTSADVSQRIEEALKRHADLDAAAVQVSVSDGKVVLDGKVRSWRQVEAAERAAWAAPGVHHVEDRIRIG